MIISVCLTTVPLLKQISGTATFRSVNVRGQKEQTRMYVIENIDPQFEKRTNKEGMNRSSQSSSVRLCVQSAALQLN